MKFKEIVHNALRKRNIDDLISVSQHTDLKKSLGIFDLILSVNCAFASSIRYLAMSKCFRSKAFNNGVYPNLFFASIFA